MPGGFLELLNAPDREAVLKGSARVSYPAGTAYRADVRPRPLALVVEHGLIRMFVESADGGQASVVYLHPGDVYAVLDILGPAGPQHLQALEDSVRVITVRSLGSMTERLAYDLLERARDAQLSDGQLMCRLTHELLADSMNPEASSKARRAMSSAVAMAKKRSILFA